MGTVVLIPRPGGSRASRYPGSSVARALRRAGASVVVPLLVIPSCGPGSLELIGAVVDGEALGPAQPTAAKRVLAKR
jgi:hypothetical protein